MTEIDVTCMVMSFSFWLIEHLLFLLLLHKKFFLINFFFFLLLLSLPLRLSENTIVEKTFMVALVQVY